MIEIDIGSPAAHLHRRGRELACALCCLSGSCADVEHAMGHGDQEDSVGTQVQGPCPIGADADFTAIGDGQCAFCISDAGRYADCARIAPCRAGSDDCDVTGAVHGTHQRVRVGDCRPGLDIQFALAVNIAHAQRTAVLPG